MTIKKFKYLRPNKYEIYLDEEKIILYEDIIINNQILLKKDITKEELNNYIKENNYYDNYYKTLNYLKFRMRSKLEIRQFLTKNKVNSNDQEKIITKLEQTNYIDDVIFAKCYLNDAINLKSCGPNKIINELKKLGISSSIIDQEIMNFTKEMQLEKIEKYITKQVKLNKNNSCYFLKQKILTNLINQGYNKEDIVNLLNNIKIDETAIYEKEYNKLKQKLSRKYCGSELELKIKQKLYQKGLSN